MKKSLFTSGAVLIGSLIVFSACKNSNKPGVAARINQMSHNAAQCPKIQEGYFNADNSKEMKFIEVFDNKDAKRLEINLNGIEQLRVDGKEQHMKNGSKLTVSCVDNSIRIVGKDGTGGLSDTTIKPAADGGLQVDQRAPAVPSMHYSQAGGLRSPLDAIKKWFTPDRAKQMGTGLPQPGGTQQPAPVPPAPVPQR